MCNKIVLDWAPSSSNQKAFEDEATRIRNDGGVQNTENYNQINSPGEKFLDRKKMELVQIDNYYYYSQNGQLTTLILSGHNLEEELKELTKRNIRGISLNWGFCGNRIKDLDFLKDYPFINHVSIIDPDFNYDGLYYLKDLQYLQIVGKKRLDFSQFTSLHTLITNIPSSFSFPQSLRVLHLWDMKFKTFDLSGINFPEKLEELEIHKSNLRTLTGLPGNINHFGILYCRNLNSLDGLAKCKNNLEYLLFQHCPHLSDYKDLEECHFLKKMIITSCSEIPDVDFVKTMKRLEHCSLYNTRIVSNDLSPLFSVPSVFFKDNKNYNHRLKEFEKRKTNLD